MIEWMKASVRKAEGDLARTMINAPFDAIVATRTASPLTPAQTARLDLNNPIEVSLTSPTKPGHEWQGTITRTEPTVGQSQTIAVIVEIEKTFAAEHLSIGLFVNAKLQATPLPDTLKPPEAALVNDAFLWAPDREDKLVKLTAKRLASESGNLFISLDEPSLEPPFRIISRPLANFEPGQKVIPSRP